MSETRKTNDDVNRTKNDERAQDLTAEPLTSQQEAKVKGGLGSIKEGLTSN